MLITFKSSASANVITFEKNARQLLDVLGKDREAKTGIVTVAQLPEAIARLRRAIDADAATYAVKAGDPPQSSDAGGDAVSFFQRGLPVLELMERALQEDTPVTWGV